MTLRKAGGSREFFLGCFSFLLSIDNTYVCGIVSVRHILTHRDPFANAVQVVSRTFSLTGTVHLWGILFPFSHKIPQKVRKNAPHIRLTDAVQVV